MKITLHAGTGHAAHNDRTDNMFSKDEHIHTEKSASNIYWSWDDNRDFRQSELDYYTIQYGDWIQQVNKSAEESRHKERTKTVKGLLSSKRYQPMELILQIGDVNDAVPEKTLQACVQSFTEYLSKYSNNMHILDYAIHNDEATPHCHLRAVFDYTDKDGHSHISKNQALQEMGFTPDDGMPSGRYNNANVVFLTALRKKWGEICIDHGLEIDLAKDLSNQQHLPIKEYQYQKEKEALTRLSEIQQKSNIAEKNLEILHSKIQKTDNLYNEKQKEKDELEKQIQQLKEEKEQQEQKIQDLTTQLQQLEETIAQARHDLEQTEKKKEEHDRKRREEKARMVHDFNDGLGSSH